MNSLFHPQLHAWYQHHGRRDLPWRNTADPYAVYISEVMLQQTQVQTVLSRYYFPFLLAFPTLQALADAPEESVLKAWQGLGYYSRAVNLHKAAQIAAPHLPNSVEGLLALPGIGRNTAHAVAAFGFRVPVPVMEANVKRVLCRVFALEHPSDAQLWEKAFLLLDSNNPFDYNQAMMDIGALICTRTTPHCLLCPLQTICQGKHAPTSYPVKKAPKAVPIVEKTIIAFQDTNGHYYLTPRTSRFLYGLYGFPEYPASELVIFQGNHYNPNTMQRLGTITQHYSHFTLEATLYRCPLPFAGNDTAWKDSNSITHLPLSRADSKALKLLIG